MNGHPGLTFDDVPWNQLADSRGRRERLDEAGEQALARLMRVADGHSGQPLILRRFLIGMYCGSDFAFDLTDLRCLDTDVLDDCLAVLAMDADGPTREIHNRIPGVTDVIAEWASDALVDRD